MDQISLLAQTSQILYDKTLLDAQKRIKKLEAEIKELKKKYQLPKVQFDYKKYYEMLVCENINIENYIFSNVGSFDSLQCIIGNMLFAFTNHSEWADRESLRIVDEVMDSVQILRIYGDDAWWNKTDEEQNSFIVDILNEKLMHQMDMHCGFFKGIVEFNCKKCNKYLPGEMFNQTFDTQYCIKCFKVNKIQALWRGYIARCKN